MSRRILWMLNYYAKTPDLPKGYAIMTLASGVAQWNWNMVRWRPVFSHLGM